MAWLLDTNAWITYLKSPRSSIRVQLEKLRPADILLCSVVKAELLHGAEKYGNRERRLALLRELFAPYVSLPFDDAAAAEYGRLRHELEIGGNVIGPNDLMIAAISLANNHTLVTHNTAEFSRVRGLTVEDWQA
jgi:tRNA(fMet)-specific endonuclease VapC